MPKYFKKANKPVAKNIKKYVKSVIAADQENKFVDFPITVTSAVASVPVVSFLSNTGIGTGADQRIGNQIRIKSLALKGCVQASSTSPASFKVRVIAFRWSGADASTPVSPDATDILQVPTNLYSQMKYDAVQAGYIHIMMDKIYDLENPTPAVAGGGDPIHNYSYFKRLNLKSTFGSNGVSLKNGLYLMTMTSTATATDMSHQFYSRIEFEDA